MSVSDAILIGEDWISEHYFTTDATSQSFHAQVLGRRKIWDDQKDTGSVRTRFTAARGSTLARLAALDDNPDSAESIRKDLIEILGFTTLGLTHTSNGPLTQVRQFTMPDVAGVALVAATPVETVEDLLEKDADTLAEPYDLDDTTQVTSVPRLLSALFVAEDAPAFALVLAGRMALIAERERWPEGRYLAIDLQLICERNDDKRGGEVDTALTCLSAESLAPDAEGNIWWHAVLDESIKHTVGVSQDLREGVRLSIEIIANDVVNRHVQQGLDPLPREEAQPLAKQALRFLYRILFLLYAEASPELGVLPAGATEYDQGYGLGRLRELIQVPLTTPASESGTHLYDSLAVLFKLVDQGYDPQISEEDEGLHESLVFRSLRADLFHPEATPHINEVKLSNTRLQQVLQHLLLSKETRGRDRGFISYAELGINQLGAVYEGLMSYTGRFAEADLYEVAKGGDSSKGSWLVPVERAEGIHENDFVRIEDPITGEHKPVLHIQGSFVFRLAGRERQQSASYYTPEVLTRFTVGQALEELLDQDGHKSTAEEILSLTVCEPALGSGAFAIEAVRQLASEYLSRRQEELSERIDPEEYPKELQKVKAYLALHNVYGVDLNATAVELAEISLWLDTMVEGLQAPWFGLHLRRGNSLIGARRSGLTRSALGSRSWQETVPTPMRADGEEARIDLIHHFLLPADGWGAAAEVSNDIKALAPEAVAALKAWRRSMKPKPTKKQLDTLRDLADRVETLWGIATRRLQIAEQQIRRDIPLWGDDSEPAEATYVTREQIEQSLADPDGSYRRLRRVMDAWCAFWFWPLVEDEVTPPSVDQWYEALRMILGGNTMSVKLAKKGDDTLADIDSWEELEVAEYNDRVFAGAKSIAEVLAVHPWLSVCERVADQQGFFHWELDFATMFSSRRGFDLQVGNPPWVQPQFSLVESVAETDPQRMFVQAGGANQRAVMLRDLDEGDCARVATDAGEVGSTVAFLKAPSNFPHIASASADLYKAFMEVGWVRRSPKGVVALVHSASLYQEERAGTLRSESYQRLRRMWHFSNERKLFEDIGNRVNFVVSVHKGRRESPSFINSCYLLEPITAIGSLQHDGSGEPPNVKNESGKWDVRPHAGRIRHITRTDLEMWSLEENGGRKSLETPFMFSVNDRVDELLGSLASVPSVAAELKFRHWYGVGETSGEEEGLIADRWARVSDASQVILQGPHLFVCNPVFQRRGVERRSHRDWSPVDLVTLPVNEQWDTGYQVEDHSRLIASIPMWGEKRADAYYRVAWRRRVGAAGIRSMQPAIIPPGVKHIETIVSVGHEDWTASQVAVLCGILSSLVTDFQIRVAQKADIRTGLFQRLRYRRLHSTDELIALRVLRLNCLNSAYVDIWNSWLEGSSSQIDGWTQPPPSGMSAHEQQLGHDDLWTDRTPLRRDWARRQALLEIDALVAIRFGLSAQDLRDIYRTQFAVWRAADSSRAVGPDGMFVAPEPGRTNLEWEADAGAAYAHFLRVLAERTGGAE